MLNTYSQPFVNSFDRIEHTLRDAGRRLGTRFEFECYDIGHLYSLAYFVDRGLAKPPFLIQGVFGILGGHRRRPREPRRTWCAIADKLFGDDYSFSAFAAGRDQMQFGTHSAWLGGHVRVGLEDSLWIGKGRARRRATPSRSRKIRAVVEDLGKDDRHPRRRPPHARASRARRDRVTLTDATRSTHRHDACTPTTTSAPDWPRGRPGRAAVDPSTPDQAVAVDRVPRRSSPPRPTPSTAAAPGSPGRPTS